MTFRLGFQVWVVAMFNFGFRVVGRIRVRINFRFSFKDVIKVISEG